MRLLAIGVCFMLQGCFGPHARYNSPALPSISHTVNGGVNIGNRPTVTETQVIGGHIYLY